MSVYPPKTLSVKFIMCSVCLCLSLVWTGAAMAGSEALLFILDGSGSMWGRMEGQPKIVIAKEVLTTVINSAPDTDSTGLMVYGHRRKGDCSDIELLAPLGSDKQILVDRAQGILPKGKTPIAAALTTAGESLKNEEEKTTLVLVSDGIETCGGDPCELVTQLRNSGLNIIVHTVGFDVNSAAAKQLSCVAQAGGGHYFAANDSQGLQEALSAVQAAVVEEKPLPERPEVEQAPQQATVTSKRIRIAGPGTVRLQPAAWVTSPRYWQLVEAETGEERARASTNECRVREGEYQVVWRQSEHGSMDVPLTEVVSVKSGATVDLPIDTGLRLNIPQEIAAPYWWGLAEPGKSKPLFTYSRTVAAQVVPAGQYDLLWHQDEHGAKTTRLGPVTLVAGKLNDHVADSGIVVQLADWMTQKPPYAYSVVNGDGVVAGRWSISGPQLVAPGDYTLIYRLTEHGHGDIVWGDVTVAQRGITPIALDSGLIFLHQQKARPPYRIFLQNLDNEREIVVKQSWDPLPVPPGRYKLDWWQTQHGSKRQTLVEELVVEAGLVLELEL